MCKVLQKAFTQLNSVYPSMFAAKTGSHTLSPLKNTLETNAASRIQHNTYSGHHYLYEVFSITLKVTVQLEVIICIMRIQKEKCVHILWLNFTCQTRKIYSGVFHISLEVFHAEFHKEVTAL